MRHPLLLILVCFLSCGICHAAPNRPLVLENSISASKIVVDSKKNIYITGSFSGIVSFSKTLVLGSYGSSDIFVAKYDPDGNCLWASNAGSDGYDEGQSLAVDESGYVYVTGLYEGNALFGQTIIKGGKNQNFFIAQFNLSGDPVWIKSATGKDNSYGCDIKLDKNNNCYVTACFYNSTTIGHKVFTSVGGSDILLLKYSAKGDLLWGKSMGSKADDIAHTSSVQLSENSLYITGSYSQTFTCGQLSVSSKGNFDAFLAKFSTGGDPQWLESIGGTGTDSGIALSLDKDGGIVVTGNYDSTFVLGKNRLECRGEFDVFVAKYASAGQNQWIQSFGSGGIERSTCCAVDKLGTTYVSGCFRYSPETNGSFSNEETFGNDLFLVKYKGSMKDKWQLLAGGNGEDAIFDMCTDQDNNLYTLGLYHGTIKIGLTELANSGGIELFFTKISPAGNYIFVKKAVCPEPNFADKTKYVNYYAKLMYGKEKASLVDQVVSLKDSNGDVIQSTKTDMYGDFSFKGISTTDKVNIVLEKNPNVNQAEPIYLASQSGEVTKELSRDKNNDFTFDILSTELMQLTNYTNEDNTNKLRKFKQSKETEVTISENILYDPGEWEISAENAAVLNKLLQYMKQNLTYTIEVLSYTDALGDAASNMALSEKRAKAITDYFVKKGIKADKIKGAGYGETKILNRCTDGVECSEREHQMNRRTEFKFIKEPKVN